MISLLHLYCRPGLIALLVLLALPTFSRADELQVFSITPDNCSIFSDDGGCDVYVSGTGFTGTGNNPPFELIDDTGSVVGSFDCNGDACDLTYLSGWLSVYDIDPGIYDVRVSRGTLGSNDYEEIFLHDAFEVTSYFRLDSVSPWIHANTYGTEITIWGRGFSELPEVFLVDGSGIEYPAQSVTMDSWSSLTTIFDLSQVPLGTYDVKVVHDGHTETMASSFTVCRELIVSSIDPARHSNRDGAELVVSGFGFEQGTTIALIDGVGNEIVPQSTVINSLSKIIAMFNLGSLAAGLYDVKGSNGFQFQTSVLENGFEVFPSLTPGSVSPNFAVQTESAGEIVVTGAAFDSSVSVVLVDHNGQEYQPISFTVNSPEQVTAVFDFRPIPLGSYDLQVSRSSEVETLPDGFTVYH